MCYPPRHTPTQPSPPCSRASSQSCTVQIRSDNESSNAYSLSVIIPAFNAEKTISRIINQVLSQSLPPSEIIVVDDGSNDDTAKIIDDFQIRYPDVVKVIHQQNGGVSVARNGS